MSVGNTFIFTKVGEITVAYKLWGNVQQHRITVAGKVIKNFSGYGNRKCYVIPKIPYIPLAKIFCPLTKTRFRITLPCKVKCTTV